MSIVSVIIIIVILGIGVVSLKLYYEILVISLMYSITNIRTRL